MQPQRSGSFVTVDDYLFGEQDGQVRHAYEDAEVYAMVGASDRHGLIAGNLFAAIHMALPEPYQAFVSDMKVRIRTDAKGTSIDAVRSSPHPTWAAFTSGINTDPG